jgi:tripartite-type tricarboxylate transporter receptor subunit TctC
MLTDLLAGPLASRRWGPGVAAVHQGRQAALHRHGHHHSACPQLPDVPTVAEQGYKGFEMTQWYGLLVPAKWPKAHVAKIEAEAVRATRSTLVRDKLANDTALAVGNTSAEFAAFIAAEQARWKPVIARAQIKPDGV